ncbi:MAG: hypothetical protein QW476_03135 [Candidatus Bathyarchaeia archaeon]
MIVSQIIGQTILFLIKIMVIALALWIVGRNTVGKKKAKFSDALWITFLGLIIGSLISRFTPFLGFIGFFIVLLLWLGLIHHFFDTGWLGALGIAIVALIVYAILSWVVSFILGVSLWNLLII